LKIKVLLALFIFLSSIKTESSDTSKLDASDYEFIYKEDEEEEYETAEEEDMTIEDPFEPFNRLMFKINDALDKTILTPIATIYKHGIPQFMQTGIENFTSNFFAPIRAVNFALQKDGEQTVKTVFRFVINTFLGFFGTLDIASKMGINKQDTDFGQTLKKWGAKPGPYLVLPLLGPTSFRGGVGKAISFQVDQSVSDIQLCKYRLYKHNKKKRNRIYYLIYGLNLTAKYAKLIDIKRELDKLSRDPYITTRNAVMQTEQ
jgi:phospholipid-binding lipoprotein MlaA